MGSANQQLYKHFNLEKKPPKTALSRLVYIYISTSQMVFYMDMKSVMLEIKV